MRQDRIRSTTDWARPPLDAPLIHPFACTCANCHQTRDPIRFARDRRWVRLQAVALILMAAGFYLFVAARLPDVIGSVSAR